jgi:hypothetical protein
MKVSSALTVHVVIPAATELAVFEIVHVAVFVVKPAHVIAYVKASPYGSVNGSNV